MDTNPIDLKENMGFKYFKIKTFHTKKIVIDNPTIVHSSETISFNLSKDHVISDLIEQKRIDVII